MFSFHSVRRDSCRLVRETQSSCLQLLLYERNIEAVCSVVRNTVSNLMAGRIPLHKLILLKPIPINKSDGADTASSTRKNRKKTIPIALKVANRMKEKDPAWSPGPGERIPLGNVF